MAGIDIDIINGALPDDLKKKGADKLGEVILAKGIEIDQRIQPQLIKTLSDLTTTDGTCVDKTTIEKSLTIRNNIVNQLNNIGKILNVLTLTLTGISDFISLILKISAGIKTAKTVALTAEALVPLVPGAVPAAIGVLDTTQDTLLYDQYGNSKLKPKKDAIDAVAVPIALTSNYIKLAILNIEAIDIIIKTCQPTLSSNILPISKEIIDITKTQIEATNTQNNTTYKGFIIEIETIPYTPTVNRHRAIGKNDQGIVLIQTSLSFTTNSTTLINELKLIIDRDNLKA